MSEIVEGLHKTPLYYGSGEASDLSEQAADEIDRLTARVAELEDGLKRMLQEFDFLVEGGSLPDIRNDIIFDEARALLTSAPEKEPTNDR